MYSEFDEDSDNNSVQKNMLWTGDQGWPQCGKRSIDLKKIVQSFL